MTSFSSKIFVPHDIEEPLAQYIDWVKSCSLLSSRFLDDSGWTGSGGENMPCPAQSRTSRESSWTPLIQREMWVSLTYHTLSPPLCICQSVSLSPPCISLWYFPQILRTCTSICTWHHMYMKCAYWNLDAVGGDYFNFEKWNLISWFQY